VARRILYLLLLLPRKEVQLMLPRRLLQTLIVGNFEPDRGEDEGVKEATVVHMDQNVQRSIYKRHQNSSIIDADK
jgi:hypothetical protein